MVIIDRSGGWVIADVGAVVVVVVANDITIMGSLAITTLDDGCGSGGQ